MSKLEQSVLPDLRRLLQQPNVRKVRLLNRAICEFEIAVTASHGKKYNGRQRLDHPAHEALAQFLATPKVAREFKSLMALAEHFHVTRMTVHRWKKNSDVLQRAKWLSRENQLAGDLVARANWERIIRAQVDAASAGDTKAAKFCEGRAWPEDQQQEDGLTPQETIQELIARSSPPGDVPP